MKQLPENAVPREPAKYSPTLHFPEKFNDRYDDRNRHLDDEIVRRCITDGDVRSPDGDVVWFEREFDGVRYRLVATIASQEIVTGYPVSIADRQAARDSLRWTSTELDDIRHFIETDPR